MKKLIELIKSLFVKAKQEETSLHIEVVKTILAGEAEAVTAKPKKKTVKKKK